MRANCLHVVVAAALTVLFATQRGGPGGPRQRPRQRRLRQSDQGRHGHGGEPEHRADDVHGIDRRQGPVHDHRPPGGPVAILAYAPGHSGDVGELSVRFGSPNPALAFTLRKNGPLPTAPLGSVTARDLQAQLAAADAFYKQQRWDEAIAAYKGDRQQDAGAQRHQPADRRGVPEQEGLRQRSRGLRSAARRPTPPTKRPKSASRR